MSNSNRTTRQIKCHRYCGHNIFKKYILEDFDLIYFLRSTIIYFLLFWLKKGNKQATGEFIFPTTNNGCYGMDDHNNILYPSMSTLLDEVRMVFQRFQELEFLHIMSGSWRRNYKYIKKDKIGSLCIRFL